MREKLFSVLGPYRERKKWRLVVFEGEARKSMFADSADEALRLKESLLHLRDNPPERPLCAALNDYLAEKQAAGLHATSLRKLQAQLRAFLPQEIRLGELTAQGAAELYRDETLRVGRFGKIHAATHHLLLRSCKAFFEWAVTRGYLAANPFRAVKPIGKAKRGKPQLREDEARKLSALLLSAASQGEEAALALSVQLLMALRSAEVLALRVRDVDSSGWKLVVEGTKTANARRALPVKSEPLRLLLLRRCTGRKPDDLLFGTGRGRPYCTDFLWDNLRRYCVAAAVPIVCPHSLRGLHASLAVRHGASLKFVAEALGHGSDEITRRHYLAADALRESSLSQVAELLTPKPPAPEASPELDKLAEALCALSPEHLRKLLLAVASHR